MYQIFQYVIDYYNEHIITRDYLYYKEMVLINRSNNENQKVSNFVDITKIDSAL